jgi:hypothetical protein
MGYSRCHFENRNDFSLDSPVVAASQPDAIRRETYDESRFDRPKPVRSS